MVGSLCGWALQEGRVMFALFENPDPFPVQLGVRLFEGPWEEAVNLSSGEQAFL